MVTVGIVCQWYTVPCTSSARTVTAYVDEACVDRACTDGAYTDGAYGDRAYCEAYCGA